MWVNFFLFMMLVSADIKQHEANIGSWYVSINQSDCYMLSKPAGSSGNIFNRKQHYLFINYSKGIYELGIVGGAIYMPGSKVHLKLEETEFLLAVIDDKAWATEDAQIVSAFYNSDKKSFLVFSSFQDNLHSVDKFSLEGFKDSLELIKEMC